MEKFNAEMLARLQGRIDALTLRVEALERQVAGLTGEDDLPVDFTAEVLGRPEDFPAEAPERTEEALAGEPAVEVVMEPAAEPEPEADPEPAPEPEAAPDAEPFPIPAPAVDRSRFPWRAGSPSLRVKNLRSAISLYDRALFIGSLFGEDFSLYDKTIGDLNGMASLDEAEDYLLARFPGWDTGSDVVLAFMAAVRKRLG